MKKICKLCKKAEVRHLIVYDCSWYECPICKAVFEVEDYWEEDEIKEIKNES